MHTVRNISDNKESMSFLRRNTVLPIFMSKIKSETFVRKYLPSASKIPSESEVPRQVHRVRIYTHDRISIHDAAVELPLRRPAAADTVSACKAHGPGVDAPAVNATFTRGAAYPLTRGRLSLP